MAGSLTGRARTAEEKAPAPTAAPASQPAFDPTAPLAFPELDAIDALLAETRALADGFLNGGGIQSHQVVRGDTVEKIARATYGDNWRAGVRAIVDANGIRFNAQGSPLIYAGTDITLPSLAGRDTAALSREGGALVANNTRGLEAEAARQQTAANLGPSSVPLNYEGPTGTMGLNGQQANMAHLWAGGFEFDPIGAIRDFFAPLGDGLTLVGQAEIEGVAGAGSSRAHGRFFAVVPHERGFDIQFGGFRTVGAIGGFDAGVSLGVGGHLGTPKDDLAGLAWAGEIDAGYGTFEFGRTDTNRTVLGAALSLGTPYSASGGRTNTTLTSFHSVQDMLDPVVLTLERAGRQVEQVRRNLSRPWWEQ